MSGLPVPRGATSEFLFAELELGLHELPFHPPLHDDPLVGDDLHLTLFVSYELHARGFDGIDGRWEWEPSLLALRRDLEERFEHALCAEVGPVRVNGRPVPDALIRLVAEHEAAAPSSSTQSFPGRVGAVDPVVELAAHREPVRTSHADAYAFALPRFPGPARAPLRRIVSAARAGTCGPRMKTEPVSWWASSLELHHGSLGRVPGVSLAAANLGSLFGLHRRWRGALAGHAAVAGLTAAGPSEERAEMHRSAFELAERTVDDEPEIAADVLLGAGAALALERRLQRHALERWERGESSLVND